MMNKEKIMDQLMDIRELTGGADSPSIDLKKDLMAMARKQQLVTNAIMDGFEVEK